MIKTIEDLTDELLHQFGKKPRCENYATAVAIDALIKGIKRKWEYKAILDFIKYVDKMGKCIHPNKELKKINVKESKNVIKVIKEIAKTLTHRKYIHNNSNQVSFKEN